MYHLSTNYMLNKDLHTRSLVCFIKIIGVLAFIAIFVFDLSIQWSGWLPGHPWSVTKPRPEARSAEGRG